MLHPEEPKFLKINMDNNAFINRIKTCYNGPEIMVHIGFVEDGMFLVMKSVDQEWLEYCLRTLGRAKQRF